MYWPRPHVSGLGFTLLALALLTSACQSGGISPGDKVGGALISTGTLEEVGRFWELDCSHMGDPRVEECRIAVGTPVNVSASIFPGAPGSTLDSVWSEHTHEMTIDERPVDLPAFGTLDVTHPEVGAARVWNIVLRPGAPGKITVHQTGTAEGNTFDYITVFVVTAP